MLAERYGWTLEYIDELDIADVLDEGWTQDAIAKYRKHESTKGATGDPF